MAGVRHQQVLLPAGTTSAKAARRQAVQPIVRDILPRRHAGIITAVREKHLLRVRATAVVLQQLAHVPLDNIGIHHLAEGRVIVNPPKLPVLQDNIGMELLA